MERLEVNSENIIGVIGGSGPDATNLLYAKVIEIARKKYGARRLEEYPHIIIDSTPILQDAPTDEELNQVKKTLCKAADRLKAADAKCLCFACNTHHLSLDLVRDHVGLPFISMVDLVVEKIKMEGYKTVAAIGTSYTLSQHLYAAPLANAGIKIVELDEQMMRRSHQLIGKALEEIPEELTPPYIEFINDVASIAKFDGLVLACTEFSVLDDRRRKISQSALNFDIVDPLNELAVAIAKTYYEGNN